MTQAKAGERPPGSGAPGDALDEIISARLISWLDEVLAGRAPNTGRFCGNCYHPRQAEADDCPHCGTPAAEARTVESVPLELIEGHRRRRGREGAVVRTIAWAGLTIGVSLALVPLAFGGVKWWSVTGFFGLMIFFYIFSANLANSVGDALGYRWGLAIFRRYWEQHLAERVAGDAGDA
ncbi:MAG TPA: hypothetical protein VIW01_03395 [Dehalococcoidia bacterium]